MKKILSIVLLIALVFTLSACGGKKDKAVSANLPEVLAKFGFGEDMMTLSEGDMLDLYFIDAKDMKQFAGAISMTGIDCEEVVLVEAVDADAANRVKAQLDQRYQTKLNETENYLPDEYAIIKTCSVSVKGNYVAMIVAENAADLVKIYEESFK